MSYVRNEAVNIDTIVRQFHVNFSNQAFEKNRALVADNFTANLNGGVANAVNGREYRGPDQFVEWIKSYFVPFPDGRITDHDVLVAGNMAAIRFTFEGIHSGPLPLPDGTSIPPTGRKVRINASEFFTFDDEGRLVHLETLADDMALIGQLTKK
jgi:predicted ester cyclase